MGHSRNSFRYEIACSPAEESYWAGYYNNTIASGEFENVFMYQKFKFLNQWEFVSVVLYIADGFSLSPFLVSGIICVMFCKQCSIFHLGS